MGQDVERTAHAQDQGEATRLEIEFQQPAKVKAWKEITAVFPTVKGKYIHTAR